VGYVDPVVRALQRINRGRLRARLVVVGGELMDAPSFVECRPWSLKAEPSTLASFDIGVMPLPDDPWTRGKCGYKLLQYFSAGVPALASPVGVNCDIVDTDRGALVQGEKGWMRALESLVGDACARRDMGAADRRFVEREYSYQRWAPALDEILRESALR
jgi:glycosyltransferase involved in cell wall biosynthesis